MVGAAIQPSYKYSVDAIKQVGIKPLYNKCYFTFRSWQGKMVNLIFTVA